MLDMLDEDFDDDSLGEITLPSTIQDHISAIDPQELIPSAKGIRINFEDTSSYSTFSESPYANNSDDSRYLFEKSYANWAAQTDERFLPASSIREMQSLSSRNSTQRLFASPETLTIHERLYNQAAVLEKRRKSRQDASWKENESKYSANRSRSPSAISGSSTRKEPVHSRLLEWKAKRDARVDRLRDRMIKARDDFELSEATFKPRLIRSFSSGALDREPAKVFEKLYNDREFYDKRRKDKM